MDELIKRKQSDFDAVSGSAEDKMKLRGEISGQISALRDLLSMADNYGIDLRHPARTFKEATQGMWLGHTAALKVRQKR